MVIVMELSIYTGLGLFLKQLYFNQFMGNLTSIL